MKHQAVLNRLIDGDPKQTLGHFVGYKGIEKIFECKSLELPDKQNQNSISRIPPGWYKAVLRWSKKYGWHYHIQDVEGRLWILIHIGNYFTQIRGCILLGAGFSDINKDGHLDVYSSGKTLKRLLATMPREFDLLINDLDS